MLYGISTKFRSDSHTPLHRSSVRLSTDGHERPAAKPNTTMTMLHNSQPSHNPAQQTVSDTTAVYYSCRKKRSEDAGAVEIPIKRRKLENTSTDTASGDGAETHNEPDSLLKRLSGYVSWILDIPSNNSVFGWFSRAFRHPFQRPTLSFSQSSNSEQGTSTADKMPRWTPNEADDDERPRKKFSSLVRSPLHADAWVSLPHEKLRPKSYRRNNSGNNGTVHQDDVTEKEHTSWSSSRTLKYRSGDQKYTKFDGRPFFGPKHWKQGSLHLKYAPASSSSSYVNNEQKNPLVKNPPISAVTMAASTKPKPSLFSRNEIVASHVQNDCNTSVVVLEEKCLAPSPSAPLVPNSSPSTCNGNGAFPLSGCNKQDSLSNLSQSSQKNHSAENTLWECIRLQEKERYFLLLQRYTSTMLYPPQSQSRQQQNQQQQDHKDASLPKKDVSTPSSLHHSSISAYNNTNASNKYRSPGSDIPAFGHPHPSEMSKTRRNVSAFSKSKLDRHEARDISQALALRRLRSKASHPQDAGSDRSQSSYASSSPASSSLVVEVMPNGIASSQLSGGNRQRKGSESEPSTSDADGNSNFFSKRSGRSSFSANPKSSFFSEDWLRELKKSLQVQSEKNKKAIKQEEMKVQAYQQKREAQQAALQAEIKERMGAKDFDALDPSLFEEEEDEDKTLFPELTPEMDDMIDEALRPIPPDEVIAQGFHLTIRRRDMETLAGLNWLNDEIINFYMNLLVERGKLDNYPSVYAFNTFFYPKLMSGGHSALRRWTRRIDIFSYDFILIPVHLGMHWCLAVVNFKEKKLQYYDSMGGKNMECLQALRNYLQDESLDKRKEEMDTTDWILETVKDIPQQMNGSDCGMFACKYAEYVTRRTKINFTQAHMPYFRRRMVYEILTQQLL